MILFLAMLGMILFLAMLGGGIEAQINEEMEEMIFVVCCCLIHINFR